MYISIGIPFYNAEKYLELAIKSVFAQTHKQWELILIDDGSTDNSLQIAKSVNDPRVRVISDGKNKKLAGRLNEIAHLAKYDIIARMDADDFMSPTRLERQLEILMDNPTLDLVTTGLYSVTNELDLVGVRWHSSTSISFKDLLMKKGCGVVHAAILARKDWFQRNPYDISLKVAQDFDLWLRSSIKNDFNIYLLPEPLYYYREEDSATPKKILVAYKNERIMYSKYGGKYALVLLIKSYAKSFIVNLLKVTNQYSFLINKRSSSKNNVEYIKRFTNEIEIIQNVELPKKTVK